MNVDVVASSPPGVHQRLELAPLVGMAELYTLDWDFGMVGEVDAARLVNPVSLHDPVVHSEDATSASVDPADGEAAHAAEQVDERDGLHGTTHSVRGPTQTA